MLVNGFGALANVGTFNGVGDLSSCGILGSLFLPLELFDNQLDILKLGRILQIDIVEIHNGLGDRSLQFGDNLNDGLD